MNCDDQQLPEKRKPTEQLCGVNGGGSYVYVNRNGFAIEAEIKSSPTKVKSPACVAASEKNPLVCTNLIMESYRATTKQQPQQQQQHQGNTEEQQLGQQQQSMTAVPNNGGGAAGMAKYEDLRSLGRSVPNSELAADNASFASLDVSSNQSLVQRDSDGRLTIKTNLTIQEPFEEFNYDNIKYIKLFGILCWWCFPITGILSIVFSSMAKKYYEIRDIPRAKKYLKSSEWMLLLTFFFGLTLIAVGFAFLEIYLFKGTGERKPFPFQHNHAVFHRSLTQ